MSVGALGAADVSALTNGCSSGRLKLNKLVKVNGL